MENTMFRQFKTLSVAFVLVASVVSLASAQDVTYPEKCKFSDDLPMKHEEVMKSSGMDPQMTDFQKEMMDGMHKTMPMMMGGMMKDDADVAFVCGMIAHHMGAIEMSKTELKHGDNEEAKAMAQKIIDAQVKEIEDMANWVEANAK
jgi:uncharacterized protein (DUF305 family)